MPGKTVKAALVDALSDLTDEDFKKFCHQLVDRRQEPRVRRNRVHGKDRMDVADVMVSTFTEKHVVGVAEEILKSIDCFEEAARFVEEAGGQSQQSASTDDKHFVDKHKVELIQRVSNTDSILDDLLEADVIKQEAYDKIRAMAACQDQMRELYAGPLKAGKTCKEIFYKILQKHEKYLIEDLTGKK
ncbi:apoptosis-associated speck-like protein containing a CARD isoform X3 [Stegastes partitus]|uniref:Apoptosis-associated speck-like protein containing a CARD isoform X2 n=1 Tax=Stegastes partitus TaxID=144197 RepID=A0A9Y4TUK6_9TELE|nr:PREDICTED: apoptosis-associated speck-like protein containing a CARD isoform X2 [Stegastes partitus]XP_008299768.1 PREDICTED: apoptosis-associated speck-like protein containing a CARD isoform X3 [Stegastes partitus]